MERFGDGDSASAALYNREINRIADSLKRALGEGVRNVIGAMSIIEAVYTTWNIGFDPQDTGAAALLPYKVYQTKRGNCLGVSLIMLMLAEKLNCPIFGVMLPGHFFCRFDNGRSRFNIEPNKHGINHPDDYYRNKYLLPHTPGYSLGNLSAKATLGVLYYNLGLQCLNRAYPGGAIACFQESARRCPDFAEAKGNLAIAWAQCGNLDCALAVFEIVFIHYPTLVNCAENYGAVAMDAKQYRKALEVYRKGLTYEPNNTKLLTGLQDAYKKLGFIDSARMVAMRANTTK
jgi:tetratricopeptide (TPR) repeat protein